MCEFLKTIIRLLVHKVTLLDPALEAGGGSHAGKTFLALQHLHPLSILNRADAVVDRGDLIAQASLRRRDIIDLQYAVASAIAGKDSQQEKACQSERQQEATRTQWLVRFHNLRKVRQGCFPL